MRLAICLLLASIICLPAQNSKDRAAGRTRPIRIGSSDPEMRPIKVVYPVYPPRAKQARIQGTVRLSVIIGTDGRVREVRPISGHRLLKPAARDAVRQFVYRPTLLSGEPVAVEITVDVKFSLP